MTQMTPIGWEAMEARWWPPIRAALIASGQPWPEEAVLFDLRWWREQEIITRGSRHAVRRPGRPTLAAEWGWSDWQARDIMRNEGLWADPLKEAQRQDAQRTAPPTPPTSSGPPADLQPASSGPPATTTANADNPQEISSPPPADLQPASNGPPHAGINTDHRSPITEPPYSPPCPPPGERESERGSDLTVLPPQVARQLRAAGLAVEAVSTTPVAVLQSVVGQRDLDRVRAALAKQGQVLADEVFDQSLWPLLSGEPDVLDLVSRLRQAGITTVGRLRAVPTGKLRYVAGIGELRAHRIALRLQQAPEEAPPEPPQPPDLEPELLEPPPGMSRAYWRQVIVEPPDRDMSRWEWAAMLGHPAALARQQEEAHA